MTTAAHLLMLADAIHESVQKEYARIHPESPLCQPLSEFQARIEEAVADFHVECDRVARGVEPEAVGVRAQAELGRKLMGER